MLNCGRKAKNAACVDPQPREPDNVPDERLAFDRINTCWLLIDVAFQV